MNRLSRILGLIALAVLALATSAQAQMYSQIGSTGTVTAGGFFYNSWGNAIFIDGGNETRITYNVTNPRDLTSNPAWTTLQILAVDGGPSSTTNARLVRIPRTAGSPETTLCSFGSSRSVWQIGRNAARDVRPTSLAAGRCMPDHCCARPLALLLALVMAMPASATQPVKLNPNVSTRDLTYDGVIVPLIGMSSEFIPHVDRTQGPEGRNDCNTSTNPTRDWRWKVVLESPRLSRAAFTPKALARRSKFGTAVALRGSRNGTPGRVCARTILYFKAFTIPSPPGPGDALPGIDSGR